MKISIYELGTNDDLEMITYYHLWSCTKHDPDEVRRIVKQAERLRADHGGDPDDPYTGDQKVSKFFDENDLHPFSVYDLRDDTDPPALPTEYVNCMLSQCIEV